MKKVVFCVPTIKKPYQVCLDSLKASLPLIEKEGWGHEMVSEVGCPYISSARSTMLRKALDAKADVIIFIDHDLSWKPKDLLKLLKVEDEVVCGTYRFKKEEVEYMGAMLTNIHGSPLVREDGCISANCVPAGFLKITNKAVNRFVKAYPELLYGERHSPHIDLFNHGAHDFVWYGEDYAFSRRWKGLGGDIWVIPDLDLDHHTEDKIYEGNYHQYLMRQPGGCLSDNPVKPTQENQIFAIK